jgi:hypothetical protein
MARDLPLHASASLVPERSGGTKLARVPLAKGVSIVKEPPLPASRANPRSRCGGPWSPEARLPVRRPWMSFPRKGGCNGCTMQHRIWIIKPPWQDRAPASGRGVGSQSEDQRVLQAVMRPSRLIPCISCSVPRSSSFAKERSRRIPHGECYAISRERRTKSLQCRVPRSSRGIPSSSRRIPRASRRSSSGEWDAKSSSSDSKAGEWAAESRSRGSKPGECLTKSSSRLSKRSSRRFPSSSDGSKSGERGLKSREHGAKGSWKAAKSSSGRRRTGERGSPRASRGGSSPSSLTSDLPKPGTGRADRSPAPSYSSFFFSSAPADPRRGPWRGRSGAPARP